MVEAVHIYGVKAAVGQNGIPALPNGSRTHFYLIQPAGIFLLQKELSRQVVVAVVAEHQA